MRPKSHGIGLILSQRLRHELREKAAFVLYVYVVYTPSKCRAGDIELVDRLARDFLFSAVALRAGPGDDGLGLYFPPNPAVDLHGAGPLYLCGARSF